MANSSNQSHYRTCNLCEAMCGLKIETDGKQVLSIKGDKHDPLSEGHICPKAVALQDLYSDPDRLKRPILKTPDGWQEISWKKAIQLTAKKLNGIQDQFGNDAVGVYVGNPTVHNLEAMIFGTDFYRQLNTKNRFSATSVDQLPHHLAAMLMYGHPLRLPIPDIDRTDHMVILGANPVVSNGSLMSAPNVKNRLKRIRKRGGRVITIDPRFTETANLADDHLFIRPGTDALLLIGMLQTLFERDLVKLNHLQEAVTDYQPVIDFCREFNLERIAMQTGIHATDIQNLVEQFCDAERAVLYARIGVSTHEFGSLTNWLVNLFNILTGNLDCEGGMMFTSPAIDMISRKKPQKKFARYFSRVSRYPETIGEFPVVALAEEILTPGKGQIKALVCGAGNPALSTPNNDQLNRAFSKLDFMVCVDFYLNETTRHADIILPPPSPLQRPHYDLIFNHLAVRDYARYSEALFDADNDNMSEADIYIALKKALFKGNLKDQLKLSLKTSVAKWLGVKGIVSQGIKKGHYGNKKSKLNQNLRMSRLRKSKHGIDLGPLKPIFPEKILTEDGKIQLTPKEFLNDLGRLKKQFEEVHFDESNYHSPNDFLLIGRRDHRTCNSWMHNSHRLVKGKPACIAHINNEDANALALVDGQQVTVSSRVGEVTLPIRITDTIMKGVISIPHGWGHKQQGSQLSVAEQHAGVSVNILTDERFIDKLSGNAALNGVPVQVSPC